MKWREAAADPHLAWHLLESSRRVESPATALPQYEDTALLRVSNVRCMG